MRRINGWIVEKYITWMQNRYVYEESEREKVRYILKTLLAELEKMFFLCCIFISLGRGKELVFSILVLVGTRRYIGGFHAKTIFGCVVVSFLYISFGIWISEQIHMTERSVAAVFLLSACLIFLWAPLKSENRPVYTSEQKLRMKLKGLYFMILIQTVGILLDMEILMISILMVQQVEVVLKKILIEWKEVRVYERGKERT